MKRIKDDSPLPAEPVLKKSTSHLSHLEGESSGSDGEHQLSNKKVQSITGKIFQKFNVNDIRELELQPVEHSESANGYASGFPEKCITKFKDIYDQVRIVGAGAFGIVVAAKDIHGK